MSETFTHVGFTEDPPLDARPHVEALHRYFGATLSDHEGLRNSLNSLYPLVMNFEALLPNPPERVADAFRLIADKIQHIAQWHHHMSQRLSEQVEHEVFQAPGEFWYEAYLEEFQKRQESRRKK